MEGLSGLEARTVDTGMKENAVDRVGAAQGGHDLRTLRELVLNTQGTVGRDVGQLALARHDRRKKRRTR